MLRTMISIAASALALASVASAGELWVNVDTVSRQQMPDNVGQILLTNPGVADIQVTSATEIMVFGKMPGFTDVIFQTTDGRRLGQTRIRVGNDQQGVVTLYNGGERYSFSCTTRCERSLTIGDGELASGAAIITQVQQKLSVADMETGLNSQEFDVRQSQPAAPSSDASAPGS